MKFKHSLKWWGLPLILLVASFSWNIQLWRTPASAAPKNCIELLYQFEKSIFFSNRSFAQPRGLFIDSPQEVQDQVMHRYIEQKQGGHFDLQIDPADIKRVTKESLQQTDLSSFSPEELKLLQRLGIEKVGELHIVTSAAGLWSRGGGMVKAVVPYNIKELTGQQFKLLEYAGDIVAAKTNKDIISLALKHGKHLDELQSMTDEMVDQVAAAIKKEAQTDIQRILHNIERHPQAITPIDIELINAAINSHLAGKYVSLDFWTSEQTHQKLFEYLGWLKHNIRQKTYHPDPSVDSVIKGLLNKYFRQSEALGETHLFGYQEGLHAIDAVSETPQFLSKTATIGKGAGDITAYYLRSGRREELLRMGKKHIVFSNIEVQSDYLTLYGLMRQENLNVGVVLVPQKQGYKGGSPFFIREGDEWKFQLREQSVLPKEFAEGNDYFNSNTIFFPITADPIDNIAFEFKEQNTIARVKLNMGDITFENHSTGIAGRVGRENPMVEYENFKSYGEYGQNGEWYLGVFQTFWENLLRD